MRAAFALLFCGLAGCQPPAPPAKPEGKSVTTADSARTWAYFFPAADTAAVVERLGGRAHERSEYRVDRVRAVRGTPGVTVAPGTGLVRVEAAVRLHPGGGPPPLFQGVPRHVEYTTREQKQALAGSRPPLTAGEDTVAVLIPIRKSAAWWAQAQDDRQTHFRPRPGKPGHTAIGAGYTDRVYRKLYHTRYAVETDDHDFLTYFEFARADATAFDELLAALRDTARNPEWEFVDREYEVWMTKTK